MNWFMMCPTCGRLYHVPTLEPETGGHWYCGGYPDSHLGPCRLVLLDQDLHDLCEATMRIGGWFAVLELGVKLR